MKAIVIRHRKERLSKCSLRGLENKKELNFFTYPLRACDEEALAHSGGIVLSLDAPILCEMEDAKNALLREERPLILLDGTWRLAQRMSRMNCLKGLLCASLDSRWQTAYPRRQEDCPDRMRGLASVEALFAAFATLGVKPMDYLDNYYWKEDFLTINRDLICEYGVF